MPEATPAGRRGLRVGPTVRSAATAGWSPAGRPASPTCGPAAD